MELFAQAVIFVFGALAMWLVNSKTKKYRFYGAICGLISQPAWFYTSWHNEQWGIFIIAFVYTAAWLRGLYNNQ